MKNQKLSVPSFKLSTGKPPDDIFGRCKRAFNVTWDSGLVITYGDTIYSADANRLAADIIVHETTHIKQQEKEGKDRWWELYFTSPVFRLKEESEAYRNQWQYCKENYNSKTRALMLEHILKCMTTQYGDMCDKQEAIKLIGNYIQYYPRIK